MCIQIDEALVCYDSLLKDLKSPAWSSLANDQAMKDIHLNHKLFIDIMSPLNRGPQGAPGRYYHSFNGQKAGWPESSDDPLPPPRDHSITYWDGALTRQQCTQLIDLFESSEQHHFEGNLMSGGQIHGAWCF
jgi:hypothetical protein